MMKMLEELREKVWQLTYENQQLKRYKDINLLMRDAVSVIVNERNATTLFSHLFELISQVMGNHHQVILKRVDNTQQQAVIVASNVDSAHLQGLSFPLSASIFNNAFNYFNVKFSSEWSSHLATLLPAAVSAISQPIQTSSGPHVLLMISPNVGQFTQTHANTLGQYAGFISGVLSLIETQRLAIERDTLLAQQARIQQSLERQEKLASIGQLAAGVAHELNNPLGVIQSNLVTLNEYVEQMSAYLEETRHIESVAAKAKQFDIDFIRQDMLELMDDCINGATKATGIVQNLRTYSHPSNDQTERVDVDDVVTNTVSIALTTVKHRAHLMVKILQPNCCVLMHKNQLSQILLNLIQNAAQAIHHDQGEITILVQALEGRCIIVVNDNGGGIAEDALPYIFDPFFTTKQVGEGTGLGLSLSRNLAEQANGTLTLDYTSPKGSSFVLTLPIAQVETTAAAT